MDKKAFLDTMSEKLREVSTKIDELKVQASLGKAEVKDELNKAIESLKKREQEVKGKLSEFEEAGEGAWQEIKQGVENAVTELSGAMKTALKRFKSR